MENISDQEKACIRALAKILAAGEEFVGDPRKMLVDHGWAYADRSEYEAALRMAELHGAIKKTGHDENGPYGLFYITAKATALARAFDAEDAEQEDIVAIIHEKVRKSKWTALLMVAFTGTVLFITGMNQLLDLLQKLGFMAKP